MPERHLFVHLHDAGIVFTTMSELMIGTYTCFNDSVLILYCEEIFTRMTGDILTLTAKRFSQPTNEVKYSGAFTMIEEL